MNQKRLAQQTISKGRKTGSNSVCIVLFAHFPRKRWPCDPRMVSKLEGPARNMRFRNSLKKPLKALENCRSVWLFQRDDKESGMIWIAISQRVEKNPDPWSELQRRYAELLQQSPNRLRLQDWIRAGHGNHAPFAPVGLLLLLGKFSSRKNFMRPRRNRQSVSRLTHSQIPAQRQYPPC